MAIRATIFALDAAPSRMTRSDMNGKGLRYFRMSHPGVAEKECLGEPGNAVNVAMKRCRNGSCRDARSMRRHAFTTFGEAMGWPQARLHQEAGTK